MSMQITLERKHRSPIPLYVHALLAALGGLLGVLVLIIFSAEQRLVWTAVAGISLGVLVGWGVELRTQANAERRLFEHEREEAREQQRLQYEVEQQRAAQSPSTGPRHGALVHSADSHGPSGGVYPDRPPAAEPVMAPPPPLPDLASPNYVVMPVEQPQWWNGGQQARASRSGRTLSGNRKREAPDLTRYMALKDGSFMQCKGCGTFAVNVVRGDGFFQFSCQAGCPQEPWNWTPGQDWPGWRISPRSRG